MLIRVFFPHTDMKATTGWVSSSKGQSGKTGLDGTSVFPCLYRDLPTHMCDHELSASEPSQSPWCARVAACPGPECGQVLAVTVAWQFTRVQLDKQGVSGAQPHHRWSLAFPWVLTQLVSAPPASPLG